MNVTVTCCRCKKEVQGVRGDGYTGGFYDVTSGPWAQFADGGESIVCDECMWADPRYRAVYQGPKD